MPDLAAEVHEATTSLRKLAHPAGSLPLRLWPGGARTVRETGETARSSAAERAETRLRAQLKTPDPRDPIEEDIWQL